MGEVEYKRLGLIRGKRIWMAMTLIRDVISPFDSMLIRLYFLKTHDSRIYQGDKYT